ncbi:MAG: MFS transporter [Thermodesulfobacteriota bacterium]
MTRSAFSIVYIGIATGLSLIGDAALYAVLPSHYVHIGLIPIQVGILLSVNRWIRLASNHVAERCYRNSPVGLWLVPAFSLGSVVTAIYGTSKIFAVLLVARILWGICFSFIRQAGIMTVVSASNDAHLGKNMGFFRGINLSGWFVGILLGGLGYDLFGFSSTFIAFSLSSLIAAPLSFLSQRGLNLVNTAPSNITFIRADLRIMLCGFAIGIVGFGLLVSTLGLILREKVGISTSFFGHTIGVATLTGMILAVRWVLGSVGSPLLGAIADRVGRERFTPVLFALGAMAMAFSSLSFGPSCMIGGVFFVFFYETLLGITISAKAGQQGARSVASYATAFDLGSALGPIIGWSIAQFGLPTNLIFVTGATFYGLGALASRAWFRPFAARQIMAR